MLCLTKWVTPENICKFSTTGEPNMQNTVHTYSFPADLRS